MVDTTCAMSMHGEDRSLLINNIVNWRKKIKLYFKKNCAIKIYNDVNREKKWIVLIAIKTWLIWLIIQIQTQCHPTHNIALYKISLAVLIVGPNSQSGHKDQGACHPADLRKPADRSTGEDLCTDSARSTQGRPVWPMVCFIEAIKPLFVCIYRKQLVCISEVSDAAILQCDD